MRVLQSLHHHGHRQIKGTHATPLVELWPTGLSILNTTMARTMARLSKEGMEVQQATRLGRTERVMRLRLLPMLPDQDEGALPHPTDRKELLVHEKPRRNNRPQRSKADQLHTSSRLLFRRNLRGTKVKLLLKGSWTTIQPLIWNVKSSANWDRCQA